MEEKIIKMEFNVNELYKTIGEAMNEDFYQKYMEIQFGTILVKLSRHLYSMQLKELFNSFDIEIESSLMARMFDLEKQLHFSTKELSNVLNKIQSIEELVSFQNKLTKSIRVQAINEVTVINI